MESTHAASSNSACGAAHSLEDYRLALKRVEETLRTDDRPEWLTEFLTQQRSFLLAHVNSKAAVATITMPRAQQ